MTKLMKKVSAAVFAAVATVFALVGSAQADAIDLHYHVIQDPYKKSTITKDTLKYYSVVSMTKDQYKAAYAETMGKETTSTSQTSIYGWVTAPGTYWLKRAAVLKHGTVWKIDDVVYSKEDKFPAYTPLPAGSAGRLHAVHTFDAPDLKTVMNEQAPIFFLFYDDSATDQHSVRIATVSYVNGCNNLIAGGDSPATFGQWNGVSEGSTKTLATSFNILPPANATVTKVTDGGVPQEPCDETGKYEIDVKRLNGASFVTRQLEVTCKTDAGYMFVDGSTEWTATCDVTGKDISPAFPLVRTITSLPLDKGDGTTYQVGDYVVVRLADGMVEEMKDVADTSLFTNDVKYATTHMVFRKIPAGRFMMQSDDAANGAYLTGLEVTVERDYYIAVFPCTEAQYAAVVDGAASDSKLPKSNIAWKTVVGEFILKLNGQIAGKGYQATLPNEAEWERAARAGTTTRWFYGPATSKALENQYVIRGTGAKVDVGSRDQNAWGLRDVYGNVHEFCSDKWQSTVKQEEQPGGRTSDTVAEVRTIRGGNYGSGTDTYCNSLGRAAPSAYAAKPDWVSGFRPVLRLEAAENLDVWPGMDENGVKFVEGDYAIVDLKSGAVTVTNGVKSADAFADDLYKTSKMVFRKVPAGAFLYQAGEETNCLRVTGRRVAMTNDYYVAVYPCTQAQYTNVVAALPASQLSKDCTAPVNNLSWNTASEYVEAFQGILADIGTAVSLPTQEQWERAACAGATGKYFFEPQNVTTLKKYAAAYTKTTTGKTSPVGGMLPNAWGLYDVYANVSEHCLDDVDTTKKALRGGSCQSSEDCINSVSVYSYAPATAYKSAGVRLVLTDVTRYAVTTAAEPAEGGAVTGGGEHEIGTKVTLTAVPNAGYSFSRWHDEITDNPRSITVTADATYTATFTANVYRVTLEKNGGTCTDLTSYTYGTGEILPTDAAKADCTFGGWFADAALSGAAVTAITTTDLGDKAFWAKWIRHETVKDDEGKDVVVSVPEKWMEKQGVQKKNLSDPGANGLPVWQSYVLGLAPTNETSRTVVTAVQTSDTDTMTLTFKDFAPRTDAGFALKYQLGTNDAEQGTFEYGEEASSCVFENVPLPTSGTGVKYYRMRAKLYKSQD